MDRRSVLKKTLTAGAAAGAATLAAPAFSQGKVEWRMVTTWPKNFRFFRTICGRFGAILSV